MDDVRGALKAARQLLLLLLFSLAFMQPSAQLLGFAAVPTDLLFVACAAAWLVALALGQTRFIRHPAYWLLIAYFVAMALSAAASPAAPWPEKLVTQVYLLSLPVLVANLVVTEQHLRSAILWWLAGTAGAAATAIASLLLFAVDRTNPLLDYTSFYFGTLPPGDYPRLRLTFLNGNMACNYLTVSLALLLAARQAQWIGRSQFALLLAGTGVAAASTISPGLGGVVLIVAIWLWLKERRRSPLLARVALAAGAGAAVLFLIAMAVTPFVHPTAPFLIRVPLLDLVLAPSGRMLTWIDSARTFLDRPLFGAGIGSDAAHVRYLDPSGNLQELTDAHNSFLNIAAQCGVVGLAALVAVTLYAVQRLRPLRLERSGEALRVGLAIGFVVAFAYEGLGGSFEDARHLWALFGLMLAADRIYGPRTCKDRGQPFTREK
jgi:hypothetical protein